MESDFKRILRSSTNYSFRTLYVNPGLTRQKMKDHDETLGHVFESEDESSPSLPVQGQNPTPNPPTSIHWLLNNAKQRAMVRQMSWEEARRIYASEVGKATRKDEEKELSDAFRNGFQSANDGLETASVYSVKQILMEMAQDVVLNE